MLNRLPLFIILMVLCLTAWSGAFAADSTTTTVRFPLDKAVGRITDMGVVSKQFPINLRKYPSKPAIGVQLYPFDHSLHLELNFHGASDLSWFDNVSAAAINSLDFNQLVVRSEGYKHLVRLDGLSRVYMLNTEVNDNDLELIGQIKNLKELSINKTNVTGAGLRYLAQAKKLKRLDLSFDPIKEPCLSVFKNFGALETLFMTNCHLTNHGLSQVVRAPRLRRLAIGSNRSINDSSVEFLMTAPHLTKLELNGTSITFDGTYRLASKKKLSSLKVSSQSVNAEQLNKLKNLNPGCDISVVKNESKIEPEIFAPLH